MLNTIELKAGAFSNQSALNKFNADLNENFGDLSGGVVSQIYTASVTLTATEIVGTATGDIGATGGAILLLAAAADTVYEFISAVLIYDYDGANAYQGGGDDLVIRVGTTTVTTPIAKADLLLATADKVVQVNALTASDQALTAATTLNLYGTAYTNAGNATGTLTVHFAYRIHTLGLA